MKTLRQYVVNGGLFAGDGKTPAAVGDQVRLYLDTEAHADFPEYIVGTIQHPVAPLLAGTAISYSFEYDEADLLDVVANLIVADVISVTVTSAVDIVAEEVDALTAVVATKQPLDSDLTAYANAADAAARRALIGAGVPATTESVLAMLANSYPRIYHVEAYGAKGDGRILTDAVITSGSTTLTSASGAFTAADVGKWIMVQQAGAAAADLRTTVASVTNSTTIVLADNAGTTVASAGRVFLGTESTAGIQAAITACAAGGGGRVYAPRGLYFLDGAFQTAHSEVATNTAQIVFPSNGLNAAATTIEVVGEMPANLLTDAYGTAAQYQVGRAGTCFYKTRLSTGYYDGMFSSSVTSAYFQPANYNTIILRNLELRNRSQTGTTQVDGKGILVDATACALFSMRDCSLSSEIAPTELVTQTSAGVRLPRQGNYCLSELRNVVIQGLGNGVATQEHAFLSQVSIDGCGNGIQSNGGSHPQTWDKVIVQRCAAPVYFSAESWVIGQITFERWASSGKWCSQTGEDITGNAVALHGRLEVSTAQTGTGNHLTPTIGSSLTRTKMQIFDINEGALVP